MDEDEHLEAALSERLLCYVQFLLAEERKLLLPYIDICTNSNN